MTGLRYPVRLVLIRRKFRGGKVEYTENGGKTQISVFFPFHMECTGKDLLAVHDGIGYAVLTEQTAGSKVGVSLESRKALWMEINARDNENVKDKPEEMEVFQMMIDHGERPQDGSSSYGFMSSDCAATPWTIS